MATPLPPAPYMEDRSADDLVAFKLECSDAWWFGDLAGWLAVWLAGWLAGWLAWLARARDCLAVEGGGAGDAPPHVAYALKNMLAFEEWAIQARKCPQGRDIVSPVTLWGDRGSRSSGPVRISEPGWPIL